jgi:hypothetical protein
MTKSTITVINHSALSKDKLSPSLSASSDQWLKHLEEEILKKSGTSIDVEMGDKREGSLQKTAVASMNTKNTDDQLNECICSSSINNKLQAESSNASNTITHDIELNATLNSRNALLSRVDGKNAQLQLQQVLQKEKTIPRINQELVNTLLQKEQQYFELGKPFVVKITGDGVKVWLSDSTVNREQYQRILIRLREGLRDIGLELVSLSINGEEVVSQQKTQVINDASDGNNSINRVY